MNGGPSETVEVEALIATSVLDSDNIPNDNQSETCFSCGVKMVGLYCTDCGQKNDNFRRSIFGLGLETFTSIFSLESRIWKTWLSLFVKPGKAAREFADGKRTLWTSPVRIYLAMSIILFGYMGLTDTRLISVRTDMEPRKGVIGNVDTIADSQLRLIPEILFFTRQKEIDRRNADVDFERVERLLDGFPAAKFHLSKDEAITRINTQNISDSLPDEILLDVSTSTDIEEGDLEDINEAINALKNKSEATDQEKNKLDNLKAKTALAKLNSLLLAYPDSQALATGLHKQSILLNETTFIDNLPTNLTAERQKELREKISRTLTELDANGINSNSMPDLYLDLYKKDLLFLNTMNLNGKRLNSSETRQIIMTSLRQPAVLNQAFATYLPRVMFLMMPFAMFVGIIFIRGKKTALMYDHLVHAAYIHAFFYLFLLVLIILSQWGGLTGLGKFFFWGMIIYLPISAKHMFQRGWFKTLLTSYGIAFNYIILMTLIMFALLAQQLTQTANLL